MNIYAEIDRMYMYGLVGMPSSDRGLVWKSGCRRNTGLVVGVKWAFTDNRGHGAVGS